MKNSYAAVSLLAAVCFSFTSLRTLASDTMDIAGETNVIDLLEVKMNQSNP
jgi:hypothetical protein